MIFIKINLIELQFMFFYLQFIFKNLNFLDFFSIISFEIKLFKAFKKNNISILKYLKFVQKYLKIGFNYQNSYNKSIKFHINQWKSTSLGVKSRNLYKDCRSMIKKYFNFYFYLKVKLELLIFLIWFLSTLSICFSITFYYV